jgi:hypothetical protein
MVMMPVRVPLIVGSEVEGTCCGRGGCAVPVSPRKMGEVRCCGNVPATAQTLCGAILAARCNMAVAVIFGHAGDPFARRELATLFGSVAVCFLFTGAGRYSVDALLGRSAAEFGRRADHGARSPDQRS